MAEKGFKVDPAALRGYSNAVKGLSGEVGKVGTGTLAGTNALPANAFGTIGAEVSGALTPAVQGILDGIAAAAKAMTELGTAVSSTLTDYERQDDDHAQQVKRAGTR
ncbi:hypothetical protein JOF53_003573 [Crossiella equi]|uniref:Excreted virulence factor EspC (Type VII ESX diderm) n=1 Tax=Crossiella equi TaxID=130796 RepID=A0ABS5ADN9_9PSEU|nr:type VII secretion target [Crossiella equi]MBP2474701.1 hypothetical protein [Crossiella equi]